MNLNPKPVLLSGIILCLSLVFTQCDNILNKSKPLKLSQLLDPSHENLWNGDALLTIADSANYQNYKIYSLKALYKKDTVGFKVSVPVQIDGNGFGKGLKIETLGIISSNLINALRNIYKLKPETSSVFRTEQVVNYVDLDLFAVNSTGQKGKDHDGFNQYKLFFGDMTDSEEDDAEVYLNINASKGIAQLREKDPEYRILLINALLDKQLIYK